MGLRAHEEVAGERANDALELLDTARMRAIKDVTEGQ
jgi:hypothetical protein